MACSVKSTRFVGYQTQLRTAIRTQFPAVGLSLCSDDRRVRWSDRILATTLVLLAWHGAATLREAFVATREVVVSMYPTRRRPGKHLEGFLKALQTRTAGLLEVIVPSLRRRTQALAGQRWRWKEWVLLGVDGSRINTPRTAANEAGFGCAGRKKTGPQQQLTTLFHLATGLPWAWRRGRGDASERHQLREMLDELPEKTLLLADAGFTGYELLSELQRRGHAFVVRVGRNVHLLTELGWAVQERRDTVYLWPKKHRDQPPLALRLITRRRGGKSMALLTNLGASELSESEAADLYRQRWELELMYRSLKQTLGKRMMRSGTPALAAVELDWALVGLWLLGLMTVSAAGLRRPWSAAGALQAVRTAMRQPHRRVGRRKFEAGLRVAVRDNYERSGDKKARDWPHKKRERPPGTPNIRTATEAETTAARRFTIQPRAA